MWQLKITTLVLQLETKVLCMCVCICTYTFEVERLGLNSGLHTGKAGALPLEWYLQSILL
jgi:hypothetical protein